MATKIKLLKLLQEMHAFAELERPHRPPQPSSLFLMQLRSQLSQSKRPKRRLVVSVDLQDSLDLPHPVRIIQLKRDSTA